MSTFTMTWIKPYAIFAIQPLFLENEAQIDTLAA
jgi:hypothetical protein